MNKKLPWFRLYVDFLNDPKIISLAFEDQRHFIGLLALKCDGAIDDVADGDLLDRIVAQRLWIDHGEIQTVKATLRAAGLIDGAWQPAEWEKYSPHVKAGDRPPSSVWRAIRARIFCRDDFTCQYCGARGAALECDHIVPVSRGGWHEDENLTTACVACNRSKRDKLVSEWRPA